MWITIPTQKLVHRCHRQIVTQGKKIVDQNFLVSKTVIIIIFLRSILCMLFFENVNYNFSRWWTYYIYSQTSRLCSSWLEERNFPLIPVTVSDQSLLLFWYEWQCFFSPSFNWQRNVSKLIVQRLSIFDFGSSLVGFLYYLFKFLPHQCDLLNRFGIYCRC